MTKVSTWLMMSGSFVAFVGLCFMPAAFGPDPDRNMLGAGAVIFAAGLLVIALSVYIKALALGSDAESNPNTGVKKARKSACDRCGENEPMIQCRVHQLHLCGDCLAQHYDFRSCAYVPSTRRITAKAAAVSQSSS